MSQPDLSKLIDRRNTALWEYVNRHQNIDVQFHLFSYYQVDTKRKNSTFFVPQNNYCVDSFTHELLHVDLTIKEINTFGPLAGLVLENPLLSSIFTEPLLHHISNTLEHVKMLPRYLELGFDRTKFISDFYQPKCTAEEIETIKLYLRFPGALWKIGVDMYLGKFFGMKACPNVAINYSSYLKQLQEIDSSLFNVLDAWWTKWVNHDIEAQDVIYNDYREIIYSLYDALSEWVLINIDKTIG